MDGLIYIHEIQEMVHDIGPGEHVQFIDIYSDILHENKNRLERITMTVTNDLTKLSIYHMKFNTIIPLFAATFTADGGMKLNPIVGSTVNWTWEKDDEYPGYIFGPGTFFQSIDMQIFKDVCEDDKAYQVISNLVNRWRKRMKINAAPKIEGFVCPKNCPWINLQKQLPVFQKVVNESNAGIYEISPGVKIMVDLSPKYKNHIPFIIDNELVGYLDIFENAAVFTNIKTMKATMLDPR